MEKKLFRNRTNRIFGGVCSGLGEYSEIDPVIWRLLFVFCALATAVIPAALVYFIMWMIIPTDEN